MPRHQHPSHLFIKKEWLPVMLLKSHKGIILKILRISASNQQQITSRPPPCMQLRMVCAILDIAAPHHAFHLMSPITSKWTKSTHSLTSCIFNAICVSIQTCLWCSEYCRSNPINPANIFSRVPSSHYIQEFTGYPLAFMSLDKSFLSSSMYFVPLHQADSMATYIRIRFDFDKGSTGNIQEQTF